MAVAVAGMTDRIERRPRARLDLARVTALVALLAPAVALLAIGLVWPFLMMLGISFQDRYPDPTALTFANYVTALTDPYFLRFTLRTFSVALFVTLNTEHTTYTFRWILSHTHI